MDEDAFFKKRGKSAEEWAEELLLKKLDAASMTPEQRELMELKKWKAEQEKAFKEQEEKQKLEMEEKTTREGYQKTVESFVKTCSEAGLPPLQGVLTLTAMELERSHRLYEQGKIEKPLTELEAANKIKKDLKGLYSSILSSIESDKLEEFVGKDTLKKYIDWDLGRKTSNPLEMNKPSQEFQKQGPAKAASPQNKVQLNETELREWKEAGRPPFHEFLKTLKKKK